MFNQTLLRIAFISMGLLALSGVAQADGRVPQQMNYQGYLTDSGGTAINTPRTLTFRLYQADSGGTAVWEETQSNVPMTGGIFNVMLGANNPIILPFREKYYLSMQVQGEASEMSPRHPLSNAAYSMASRKVVYQQVITVAQDGGDTCTVYGALQMIAAETPAPDATHQWIIEVQAGTFTETNSLTLPDYVILRGQSRNATILTLPGSGTLTLGNYSAVEDMRINLQSAGAQISMNGKSYCSIRGCWIQAESVSLAVDMTFGTGNEFTDNCVSTTTGAGQFLNLQEADSSRVENCYFSGSGIGYVMSAYHIATTVISKNLFEITSPSTFGIVLDNYYTTGRVSNNLFYGDNSRNNLMDIYNTITGAYPARPAHTGPYGISNQGSSGSELPAF